MILLCRKINVCQNIVLSSAEVQERVKGLGEGDIILISVIMIGDQVGCYAKISNSIVGRHVPGAPAWLAVFFCKTCLCSLSPGSAGRLRL